MNDIPFGDFRKLIDEAEERYIDGRYEEAEDLLKSLNDKLREELGIEEADLKKIEEDLKYLCEDNQVMRNTIERYFDNR